MYTHKIIHIGTMVEIYRFFSFEDAKHWLDNYGATQTYKDQFYRILPINPTA